MKDRIINKINRLLGESEEVRGFASSVGVGYFIAIGKIIAHGVDDVYFQVSIDSETLLEGDDAKEVFFLLDKHLAKKQKTEHEIKLEVINSYLNN